MLKTINSIFRLIEDNSIIFAKYNVESKIKKNNIEKKHRTSKALTTGSSIRCAGCSFSIANPILNYSNTCPSCNTENNLFICPNCMSSFVFANESHVSCPLCHAFFQLVVCNNCKKINIYYSMNQCCNECNSDLSMTNFTNSKSLNYLLSFQIALFRYISLEIDKSYDKGFFINEYYKIIGDKNFITSVIEQNWDQIIIFDDIFKIAEQSHIYIEHEDLLILLHQTTKVLANRDSITGAALDFITKWFEKCGISEEILQSFLSDYFIFFTNNKFGRIQKIPKELLKYYYILDLSNEADLDELKQVYRNLAKKYHPDKNNNKSESEKKAYEMKFITIKEAYEKLFHYMKN